MDNTLPPDENTDKVGLYGFVGALWHSAFLAMGTALTQPTTVIAAFIADLTGSTVWVGGLATVLAVANVLPQLFVARRIEPRPYKKPYLLLAIYLRTISWGVLAWLIVSIGASKPQVLAWTLVGLLAIFSIGGGLGGVPYTDIIGKVIAPEKRGTFFGGRSALAGPLSVGAALLARHILANVVYPNNYALLFGLAAGALLIASLGFWIIHEPPRADADGRVRGWREYREQLLAAARRLRPLIGVQILTGFSMMAMPFYVVYARKELGAPPEAIAWFMLAQVVGGALSNLLWARLVNRYGGRRMLAVCATISTGLPLLAIVLGQVGWSALVLVIFIAGAIGNGRSVGFSNMLLILAPAEERPTYSALNGTLTLPMAFLPLVGGMLLKHWSYAAVFILVAVFTGMGRILTRWLPETA